MIEGILLAIMAVLTALYASWLVLAAIPGKRYGKAEQRPVSVIIPAYNEEKNIADTLRSLAGIQSEKEVIVVDDGSADRTASIAKSFRGVKVVKGSHEGKAKAVNLGMKHASHELVVILDADTVLDKNAIEKIIVPFSDPDVAAVASTLRVKRTSNILNWFQQFEYAISTGWRYVVDKVGGLCIVPGFCAFRKSMLLSIGGFRGDTAVEDYDICMYLRKKGYKIAMAPDAIAYTVVPQSLKGWAKQRIRWNRGTLQVMRKHSDVFLNRSFSGIGLYSMPTQFYWFVHALLYLPLVLYQIFSGYAKYFVQHGVFLSADVGMYFFKWLTVYGMADFIYQVFVGNYPATLLNIITIIVFALSYVFAVFSMLRFAGKISIQTVLALLFFFPYTLVVLAIYLYSTLHEIFSTDRGEKWEKVH